MMALSTVWPDAGSESDVSWEIGTITLSPPSAFSKTLRLGHDGGVALSPCDVEGEVVSMALEEPDLLFFALDFPPGAALLGCCLSAVLDNEAGLVVASLFEGETSTDGSSAADEGGSECCADTCAELTAAE